MAGFVVCASEGLFQTRLLEDAIGRMPGLDMAVHNKALSGNRALPPFVIALALANALAPMGLEQLFKLRRIGRRHYAGAFLRRLSWTSKSNGTESSSGTKPLRSTASCTITRSLSDSASSDAACVVMPSSSLQATHTDDSGSQVALITKCISGV